MSAVDVASQPFAPTAEDQLLDLNERADEAARIAFQLESLATELRDHLAELISDGAKIPPDVEEVVDRLYQTAGEACRDVEDWAADPREDDADARISSRW